MASIIRLARRLCVYSHVAHVKLIGYNGKNHFENNNACAILELIVVFNES